MRSFRCIELISHALYYCRLYRAISFGIVISGLQYLILLCKTNFHFILKLGIYSCKEYAYLELTLANWNLLFQFSEMGKALSYGAHFSGYRYIMCGNYMVFYHIDGIIYVDRLIYAKRDYMNILFP